MSNGHVDVSESQRRGIAEETEQHRVVCSTRLHRLLQMVGLGILEVRGLCGTLCNLWCNKKEGEAYFDLFD